MISVGCNDRRKGLGFGGGAGGIEMEATEIEEGEALVHQNDADSTVDPDVALAYLDEKLEHVLGHFQKDFEGGVSAENLGSKFGGYGSFLPTYQRSPTWSHARTPPKVQNHSASRSPTNLPLEAPRGNSISSSASLSGRHGLTALGMETVPPHRASSVENCVKQERTMPLANADNKADNQSDQKTFKVRIKMGSDNLSTKNNAEIYSGLGLDVSPTSSFEDSPIDVGLIHEPRNSPEESPTSILQIMTSFPLHGSLLLSPLHDDLISLTDKEMLSRGSRSVSIRHKGSQEGSLISINGSDSNVSDRKHVRDKKPKSSEKKAYSVQSKNNNIHNTQNGVDVLSKKETDADTSLCDELVSSAMRLPLLSNSHGSIADSAKDTAKVVDISGAVNTGAMEESFCDPAKDQPWGPASIQENGFVGKSSGKAISAVKVSESKKPYAGHDASGYPEKGGNHKSNKIDTSSKVDPDMTKVRKGFAPELMDYAKNKSGQKAIASVDDDKNVSSGKENSSSVGKKKSKGSQSHVIEAITEVQNVKTQTSVVSAPKSGKTANLNGHISEVEDSKQDIGKAKDRYTDFFGDLDLDNDIAEDGVPSIDKSTNCLVFDKGNGEFDSLSKDRSGSKKIDQSSTSEAYTRASSLIPPTGNRLIFDAGAPIAPLVQEDWVGCDKCQKWRLLPAGKNPQSLPKIWLCSMLDWLDGMNRCSVSEEETTRAVLALHQAPAPAPVHEGQSIQNRYSGVASSVVDALHVDQSLQDISGKKKHGSREVLNASSQNGSSPYLNSKKQIPHASAKNRSLNGENHSPSLNEVGFQLSGQPSPLVEQKRRHKRKEKSIPLTNLGEGDTKRSKIRNKRENNPEFLKVSKKLKTSAVHIDEDWKSDNGGAASKVGRNSSNVTSISNKTGKHRHRYDHPKDSMRDSKVSVRNAENRTEFPSDARLLHMENYADGDAKKRKIIDYQEDQLYTATRSTDGHRLDDHRDFLEETSESNHRKEKKPRVSMSGGRESSMSKGSGGIEKKGWRPKDQPAGADLENSLFCRSLDAINLVKKDVGFAQPPVAATSSSSKVSGSRKSKTKLQEAKGSPVESVSSSPLRVFNQDKFTLTSRDLGGKGDSEEAIILATSSPKKCLVGEDGIGSDQSRVLLKNETPITINGGGCNTQDRNQSHVPGRKTLAETASSPEFATHYSADILQSDQHRFKRPISEQCPKDESGKKDKYHNNGSRRKSGKGSSSRSKDKSRGTRSESEKGNLKAFDSNGHAEHSSYDKNSKARSKLQERTAPHCEKAEKNIFPKNDPAANPSTEIGRREAQSKRASFGSSDGRQVIPNHDSKQNLPVNCNSEKSSKRFPSDKTDQVDVSGKGKSHSLPPSGRGQNEFSRWPQPVNGNQKDNGVNLSTVSTSEGGDALKAAKDIKRSENQNGNGNGNQPITSRNSINVSKGRDIDAPSPVRRDSSIQTANNAVKEAKDLKHLADRLKNSGSSPEITGYYFQAALKFLYGASIFESCNNENAKHGEMIQSMQMYSSTAKLCEFCAHEYEKSKDMASASLAYKCAEVAYFRVINFSHISASRDRQEMQNALQIVPPGESPSSSASDVDNMNNAATTDKIILNKGVNSPQIAGNHVITARSRPNFVRLLNFVQDVNFAMEASRKSRIAFSAANSREETRYREGLPSVKKALDYNFYDVEELLRLMRLAMEAISR